ncbi:MAG: YkgJ family cysteine cluster protein [Leptonema illini]|uniref:YkgJ family cysteine cluster protein n=1 Tax=Leptonema illini TaxID=183 RepID=A0A833GUU2_9LEPT|nr:MAG: YkgJ family cysteine cluster protein [Leptonema illini]
MPVTTLPDPDQDIRLAYLSLVKEIELAASQLAGGRLAGRITCRPGCSSCCRAFSVLPLEAALLQRVLPAAAGSRQEGDCVFLGGGLCTVYSCRPVICRTQGLPLAYVDEILEQIEVSACPLNFPEDAELDHDELFFMDAFNERLAALNLLYCRRHGLDPDVRIALADLLP